MKNGRVPGIPLASLAVAFTAGFSFCLAWMGWHALLPGVTLNEAYGSHWILWLLLWFVIGFEFVRRKVASTNLHKNLIALVLVAISASVLAVTLLLPSLEGIESHLTSSSNLTAIIDALTSAAILFVPGFLIGAICALGLAMAGYGSQSSQRLYVSLGLLGCFAAFAFAWMMHIGLRHLCFIASLLPGVLGIALGINMARKQPETLQVINSDHGENNWARSNAATFALGSALVTLLVLWLKIHFYVGASVPITYGTGIMALTLGLALGAILSLAIRSKRCAPVGSLLLGVGFALLASRWHDVAAFYNAPSSSHASPDIKSASVLVFLPAILGGITLTHIVVDTTRANAFKRFEAAIAGVAVGILVSVFLPNTYVGFEGLTRWLPLAFVGCGLLVADEIRNRLNFIITPVVLAVILGFGLVSPQWNMQTAAGVSTFLPGGSGEVIYYRESPVSATAVTRTPYEIAVWEGGKIFVSMPDDLISEVLAGHIPLMLHPEPHRILVLGASGGALLNAIEKYDVDDITCVGFSPDLIGASTHLGSYNQSPFEDKRLKLAQMRICRALKTTGAFDIIVIDHLRPTFPLGRQNVTKEMIALAKGALRKGGILAQRLALLEASHEALRSSIVTFASQFPFAQLWLLGSRELLLVGSDHPPHADLELIANRMIKAPIGEDLGRIGIDDPAAMLNCYLMSKDGILKLAAGSRAVCKAEALYRVDRQVQAYPRILEDLLTTSQDPLSIVASPIEKFKSLGEKISSCRSALKSFMGAIPLMLAGKDHRATAIIEEAIKKCDSSGIFRHFLSDYYVRIARRLENQGRVEEASGVAKRAIKMNPTNPIALYQLARVEKDKDLVEKLLEKSIEIDPYYTEAYIFKAQEHMTKGEIQEALKTINKILGIEPFNRQASYLRALALIRTNQLGDAHRILEQVVRENPEFLEATEAFAYVLILEGELDRARKLYRKLASRHPDDVSILNNYATVVAEQGDYEKAIRIWEHALSIEPNNMDIKANIEEARSKLKAR